MADASKAAEPAAAPDHTLPRLLVVGCGQHATGILTPAIASLGRARIIGVCDADPTRADHLCTRFDLAHSGSDPHPMIDELRPDAVVLAGPPQMHEDIGLHALEAGCHVLVEKPPAVSTLGVQKLAAAAEAGGLTGMVAHNLRHTAAWRRATAHLSPSNLTSVAIMYHASGPTGERWGLPPLEAFLLTHAVHVFDLFNAVLGAPATTTHHIAEGPQGTFVLSSRWHAANGALGTAVITTCAPRFDWQAQITTTAGALIHIASPRQVTIHEPSADRAREQGDRATWAARGLDAGYDTAGYGTELAHFLDCLTGPAQPTPSFTDELAVYQALDDLYSQADHRRGLTDA